jgi:hypothetical protein
MNSKTILLRALLAMLLAILGAGCAPPDPATDPSHGSAPAQERREGKFILTAKLDGAAVVAVLVRETLCRDRAPARGAVVVVGGAVARGRGNGGSWEPCGVSPVAGASLELGMNTPTKLIQSTNSEGMARFDLSAVEPTPELVLRRQAGVFAQGGVAPVLLDLSACPLMTTWVQRIAAPERAQTSDDLWAEARRDHALRTAGKLDQVELDLAALEASQEPWGASEVTRFETAHAALSELVRLTPLDPRVERAVNRHLALHPRYERAQARLKQQVAQQAAQAARRQDAERRSALPVCVQCCLTSRVNATRDHCEAACTEEVFSYGHTLFFAACNKERR